MSYIVRTIFLQNYFTPAKDMAEQRRGSNPDMNAVVSAMKRTELAQDMLAQELSNFADKGYQIVNMIQHPFDEEHPSDLLMTVILSPCGLLIMNYFFLNTTL